MTESDENGDEALLAARGDGRQSLAAAEIARGTVRLLARHAFASLMEMSLPSFRRADVVALSLKGDLWIVEIKSSLDDFRTDQKWPEYRDFCDRLYFAVKPDFPREVLPEDTGLIVADRWGGEIVRDAPEHRLAAARRKSMTLRFARAAAFRHSSLIDPGLAKLVGEE